MPLRRRLGFLFFFVVPALLPFSAWLGAWTGEPALSAWFPLFFLFVLLPIGDLALGLDRWNPAAESAPSLSEQQFFRWLTLAAAPIYGALLLWSAWHFTRSDFGLFGNLGWLLSQGLIGGIAAINVAHELIHKAERSEQWAGGWLLACVGYGSFKIEHVRGHHVHVSTPEDASSASIGENVYRFVPRAIVQNLRAAVALEQQRLARDGLSWWRSELLAWSAITVVWALTLTLWLGPVGGVFFCLQAIGAICSLEIINYLEHYGLRRTVLASGRYERPNRLHSWNSNYWLSNCLLFELQRHSDHHESPRRRYQVLEQYDESPQLPFGYATMFLIALVPPLFHRLMNPRVADYSARLATLRSTSASVHGA